MKIGRILYVTDRKKWRSWLSKNHNKESEIWLVFYRKDSGKPRISYDDAVLEALCFGWIDSIVKKVDGESFVQRFSPRKPISSLSEMNKVRIRELIAEGKMTSAGLKAIAHVWDTDSPEPEFKIPPKILSAIKANPQAWKNYQKLPGDYKRIRIAYIESRKRHSTGMYRRALANFIRATAQGRRIGAVKERKSGQLKGAAPDKIGVKAK